MKKNLLTFTLLICALSANTQIDLSNGLLAHYPFEGNANDASGNGHHATVNGVPLTVDRFGNADGAYQFDGTGNWIDVTDLNQQLYGFSVAVWAKSSSGNIGTIISKHSNSADATVLIRQENGSNTAALNAGNTFISMNGGPISPTNDYDFLVLTYDGLVARFYVNNIEVAASQMGGDPAVNSLPWAFGRYAAGGGITEYYTGDIDDVKIYDRNLNTLEIDALYNESTASVLESNLSNMLVYPNPAKDQLTISAGKQEQIELFDMLGNELLSFTANGVETIDISEFPKGIYLIKSKNGQQQFIKQ